MMRSKPDKCKRLGVKKEQDKGSEIGCQGVCKPV